MARVVERGLRRTVGVPGLFATAYGNVGSSIYYALGLVAAYALGLTPLVFIFAGGLFALTAKTWPSAEAIRARIPGGPAKYQLVPAHTKPTSAAAAAATKNGQEELRRATFAVVSSCQFAAASASNLRP